MRSMITMFFLMMFFCPLFSSEKQIKIPTAKVDRSLYLKGDLKDSFWVSALKLQNLFDGELNEDAKRYKVYCVQVNDWLLIGTNVAEQKGVIAREYMNGEALWLDDNLKFQFTNEKASIEVIINPLGAYVVSDRINQNSELVKKGLVVGASFVDKDRWSSVIAVHKSLISDSFQLDLIAERHQRGFDPFMKPKQTYKLSYDTDFIFDSVPLVLAPRQALADLQVVVGEYQPVISENIADWAGKSSYELKNVSSAETLRTEFQKTKVSIMANEKELGVFVECNESTLNVADAANLFKDDALEIFIGPDGGQYLQFSLSPFSDTVSSRRGLTGGRGPKRVELPASVKVVKKKTDSGWSFVFKVAVADILKHSDVVSNNNPITNQWNFQIVRFRSARPALGEIVQESFLVLTQSANAHSPARFARVNFQSDFKQVKDQKEIALMPDLLKGNSEIQGNSISIWKKEYINARQNEITEALSKLKNKTDWEAHTAKTKKEINKVLFGQESLPPATKLKPAIAFSKVYEDVEVSGHLITSRLGLPVTLTVFKPIEPKQNMPALMMVPAHHTGRNSIDLYITGFNFAKAGGLAISIDTAGSGERGFAARWNHKNHQRYLIGQIMRIAGEEIAGYAVSDIFSVVDYLFSMKDVDKNKIGLMGGVAGGGDVSGLAAALDARISVNIPFNFSHENVITPWYDYTRTYNQTLVLGVSPWLISAMVAPRKHIQAEEFAWLDSRKQSQEKFKEIWSLYDAKDSVTFIHGWAESHATHFNHMHRIPIYKILNDWWQMKLPETREAEAEVTFRREGFEVLQTKVGRNYIQDWQKNLKLEDATYGDLVSKNLKQIKPNQAKQNIDAYLKDISVLPYHVIKTKDSTWNGFKSDGFILEVLRKPVENKLAISGWVLKPKGEPSALTICISRSGKSRFLYEKSKSIMKLLDENHAVILLDLSGVGETEISSGRLPESLSSSFAMFLNSIGTDLIQWHLSDLKTVFDYVETKTTFKDLPITLWGAEFMPANGKSSDNFKFDETGFRQAGPSKKYLLETNGTLLAMFGSLLNDKKVKSIVCENYLTSFKTMLSYPYTYITTESLIDSVLEKFDIPDVLEQVKNKNINTNLIGARDAQNRIINRN